MIHKDRKSPRAIVRLVTTIQNNSSHCVCSVVDISLTGARLYLDSQSQLDETFMIDIKVLADLDPIRIQVKKVWHASNFAGVLFLNLTSRQEHVLNALIKIHRAELSMPS